MFPETAISLPNSATRFEIDDSRELILLQVKLALTEALLAEVSAGLGELAPLTERPFRDPLIAEICRRMVDEEVLERHVGLHALSLVIGLLVISARRQVSRARGRALSERRVRDVIARIDSALDDTITVEQLAGLVGMPTRKFSTAFRDALGMPVYQYVLQRRAERVRELLTSTELSLSEIAQQVGFSHQAHMNRVIKRLLGQTPAQIRNASQ